MGLFRIADSTRHRYGNGGHSATRTCVSLPKPLATADASASAPGPSVYIFQLPAMNLRRIELPPLAKCLLSIMSVDSRPGEKFQTANAKSQTNVRAPMPI